MSNPFAMIREAIAAIKACPHVEMETLEIAPPAPPDLIDRLELMGNVLMPEDVKALYLEANGLTCRYRLRSDLDEQRLQRIRQEGEEADFDYGKTLGSLRIIPIQDALFNKLWKPPSSPEEQAATLDFAGATKSLVDLGKMTRPFDWFEVENDAQAMAFFIENPFSGDPWKVLMLDDHLADWRNSLLSDFATYIQIICATRFTIPSRRRLYSQYRGDTKPKLRWESLDQASLLPALFSM